QEKMQTQVLQLWTLDRGKVSKEKSGSSDVFAAQGDSEATRKRGPNVTKEVAQEVSEPTRHRQGRRYVDRIEKINIKVDLHSFRPANRFGNHGQVREVVDKNVTPEIGISL